MIKAIFYDLGDIFYNNYKWRLALYRELHRKSLFKGDFTAFYLLYERYVDAVYKGQKKYRDGFREFFEANSLPDWNDFFERYLGRTISKPYKKTLPGIIPTLKKLKSLGIKNIIISDATSTGEQLRERILKELGVAEYIDDVISSAEVGFTKPSPEIFEHALKKNGLAIDEVIFVAHDKDELDGARKIGIRTVEFNNFLKLQIETDHKIKKFSSLFKVVRSLNEI